MKTLTIDDVYDTIGHFGWAQLIYFLALGSLQLFIALHMLLSIFLDLETPFVCTNANGTSLLNECPNNSRSHCVHLDFNSSSFESVSNEWDYVCEDKFKLPLIQSIWMAGVMAGALFLGGLADKIGRLMTLMVFLLCTIGFESFSAFSHNYIILLIFRFAGGACCSLIILSAFVLTQELIGASRRSIVCLLQSLFFAGGIGVLALLAFYLKDWRTLTLVCSLVGVCFIFIPCVVPESPRWLLGAGEAEKAKQILENISKKNGTFHLLPARWELATSSNKKNSGGSILDLVSHRYIFMLTLIMIYSWFVTSASYYALTMAASSLPGNIYVSTTLNGLVEVPALIIGIFIIDRFGRRIAICCSMVCSGLACIVIVFLPQDSPGITICALLGKLCISGSFAFIYIHSGEIFPTVIRNTGLGVVSVAARLGGILSPFILTLKDIMPNLHFITLGISVLIAGFLNLKLPETAGRPMPESISDILKMKDSDLQVSKKKTRGYSRLITDEDDQIEGLLEEDSSEDIKIHPINSFDGTINEL